MFKFYYKFEIHLYHNKKKEKLELFKQRDRVAPQMMRPENPVHKRQEEREKLQRSIRTGWLLTLNEVPRYLLKKLYLLNTLQDTKGLNAKN